MRVIFMGTPDFAAVSLEYIYRAGYEIAAVVSQPDKPVGRHSELRPTEVKRKAAELGISEILQPEKASDPAFIAHIRELAPDVIVVAAYGRILKKELLDIPRYGCINVHASLLPRWRGAAPIQWAIIEGDKEAGVTTMQMAEGLDTGDILMTRKLTPAPDETGGSLFDKLAVLGGELICDTLSAVEDGSLTATPQSEEGATYARQLTKDMGLIDWSRDAESIERLIRGLYPWPGTYTYHNGRMLKLHKARLATDKLFDTSSGETESVTAEPEPGSVMVKDEHIFVRCGIGALEILELQPESKKRMSAGDYLRGNTLSGRLGQR